ncbi:MAG: flavodoxin family protein [Oscillospiraceae bacterium]|nr:flavodoxin family protein [Oscillospiraceae bacterium]
MKIVAVNASPRKTWNTSKLVRAAADGAKSAGADTEIYDLYTLGKFSGCISCFGCMKEKHFGECVCNDALKPVLDSIRTADGLILGTPNYLGEATAAFRSLYERLIFQYITYNSDKFSANTRHIPVLFIMTSNAGDAAYEDGGMYSGILQNYKNTLSRFIGPANVLVAGDTLQVNDYSHYDWTMFDPVSKARRNEKVFPEKLSAAERMGREMAVVQ